MSQAWLPGSLRPADRAFEILAATEDQARTACQLRQAQGLILPLNPFPDGLAAEARSAGLQIIGVGPRDPATVRMFYEAGWGSYWFEDETLPEAVLEKLRPLLATLDSSSEFKPDHLFWSTITDLAPVMLFVHDLEFGRALWANRTAQDFLGLTQTQVKELSALEWASRVHEDDHGPLAEHVDQIRHLRQDQVKTFECRMRHHNGTWRWLGGACSAFRADPEGRVTQVIGATQDITDYKRSEETLRATNEVLANFTFAVAHDLREPLRTVMTCSEILAEAYREPTHPPDAIRIQVVNELLSNGIRRMDQLLLDLLEYIKVRGVPAALELVDCKRVVERVQENCRNAIEEAGASLEIHPLPSVPGHEVELVSLFQNLISNALKYRSASPPIVKLSAMQAGGQWVFSVQDNGEGISPAYRQMIFGMFKRLHSRKVPGTGIGLAICENIVSKYGGRIWVEDAPGGGSIFRLTWPVARDVRAEGGSA